VHNLSARSYDIHSCAQEHSLVPKLWLKFCRAEVLVYLDAELPTIAQRQNRSDWTHTRLDAQRVRLADARLHCDLYLRTDELTRLQVADAVERYLRGRGILPGGGPGEHGAETPQSTGPW
jgi:hypothetical protein